VRSREREIQEAPGRDEEDPRARGDRADERTAGDPEIRVEEDRVVQHDRHDGKRTYAVERRQAIARSGGLCDRTVEGHRSTLTRSGPGGKQWRAL
jgi:hypothetical protein